MDEVAEAAPDTRPEPARDPADGRAITRALVVLCLTELVAWGVLFYALPVAVESMSADTGWSRSGIFGAYSAGLVVSAFVGIPMGWLVERHGPRYVMVAGSFGSIPGLVLVATAESMTQLVFAWVLCGLAMPALFYQVAFAACTAWMGAKRIKGITAVTLAGGLASTVFAPLTSWLLHRYDWRTTWLILAVVLVVTLVPLQLAFLTPAWTPVRKSSTGVGVGPIVRSARFLALSASVTVFTFSGFAVGLTVVSLMTERGYDHAFGATVLGVIGIGQLLGRLGFGRFGSARARNVRNLTIVAGLTTATALYAVVPGPAWVMVAVAVLLGAARGAGTLMHATIVVDIWGPVRYGALIAVFSVPITLSMATSPWIGAALADLLGSFAMMDAVMAVVAAVSGVGIYLCTRRLPSDRPRARSG